MSAAEQPEANWNQAMKTLAAAAVATLIACTALSGGAFAQTTAATALPPGGLTVAGPGTVTGGFGAVQVFSSATAMALCVSALNLSNTSSGVVTLTVGSSSASNRSGAQSVTVCNSSATTVTVGSLTGNVFYRIDRMIN